MKGTTTNLLPDKRIPTGDSAYGTESFLWYGLWYRKLSLGETLCSEVSR